MDPAKLIPAAEAIPSPWGWFEALLLVTFVLHIIFMNLAVGSAALAFFGRLTGRHKELARELGHRAPTFLAFTVNLGVAPLLFVQVVYGQFLYTSSVLMAGWWLSAILAVILGYYALYAHDGKFETAPGLSLGALGLSLVFLAYTGFLLSNNMTLMLRPEAWTAYFARPDGSLLNLADPTMWSRFVHIMLAAPAVAGLYAALLGQKKQRPDWVAYGLAWFSRVTMLQILIGGWVFVSLPSRVRLALMGGDVLATAMLAASILLGLAALYAALQKKPVPTAALALAAIACMGVTRGQVRLITLAPYFHPSSLPVAPQISPLVMFLAVFVLGLWGIGHMLRLYAKSAPGRAGRG
ncbi:MAG: hypothetical protein AUJ49_04690 [Desulfovibrionaceae bacterium CG1_02_65_16]|nr:MAG: hypothetical protein AUJ49_04690 [Desulfovibrionaceae bacterium CG1_02_65_16]